MKSNFTRHCLLALLLSLISLQMHAQYVLIPDSYFRNWLHNNGFASCFDGTGTMLDTTCSLVVNREEIYCPYSVLSNLDGIQYFDNLLYLSCHNNLLTNIPTLPPGLLSLTCSGNQLTSLPTLPTALNSLSCSANQLTSLPTLPSMLAHLSCAGNQLSSLPPLPPQLESLSCNYNQITSLPSLPPSLIGLYCTNNQLTALPVLSEGLIHLQCSHNQLTQLPTLPSTLARLTCTANQLTSLPPLPAPLIYLYTDSNQLMAVPALGEHVRILFCSHNQLAALPAIPASMNQLHCSANQLTNLPAIPDTMFSLHCKDNPQLTCLPKFTCIQSLKVENTGIHCLPFRSPCMVGIPQLDSLPVCDLMNADGCDVYRNMSGHTFADVNANCVSDADDFSVSPCKLSLEINGTPIEQTYSGEDGAYFFNAVYDGIYSVWPDTTDIPLTVSCPDSGYYVSACTSPNSFDSVLDFAFECKPGFDVGAWAVVFKEIDFFRPGSRPVVEVRGGDMASLYGFNCAAGVSGQVQVVIEGPCAYWAYAPNALTPIVSGDTLTYNIPDFGLVNEETDFVFVAQIDSNAVIGQNVCMKVYVTPVQGDNNTLNNFLGQCFTVGNSYDPNDKQVYPSGNIDTTEEWLTYKVRFQNTGNAPAQHINITDTLDSNLDASTFRLLAYSHQPSIQIYGRAVKFSFPFINLPDSSSNEPASHGYVQYKVRLRDNLPIGTQISNTAFIYFDLNEAVITNTTMNVIAVDTPTVPVGVPEVVGVMLWPNPASDVVNVQVSKDLVGSELILTNIYGEELKRERLFTPTSHLSTNHLPSGLYFLHINGNVKRLVIQ